MLFGMKNRPFVSVTFHRSRRGFAPEANVATIGRPKMAYPYVETKSKKAFLTDLIHFYFIWHLKRIATYVSQEVGHLSVE